MVMMIIVLMLFLCEIWCFLVFGFFMVFVVLLFLLVFGIDYGKGVVCWYLLGFVVF